MNPTTTPPPLNLRHRPTTAPTVPPHIWHQLGWVGRKQVIDRWHQAHRHDTQIEGVCTRCEQNPVPAGSTSGMCKPCRGALGRERAKKPCPGCGVPVTARSRGCRSCSASARSTAPGPTHNVHVQAVAA